MATFMERLAFLQKVPTLMKATADDENPCPGYLFQEIGKISHESLGCGQCLLEYLLERIQVDSCHVKLKVLKIFVHLCGHGSEHFLTELRRNSTFIQQASVYSGAPDPIHGTALYQKVRNTAQEVARLLFTDVIATKSNVAPKSLVPATMGMGATSHRSGLQGFGYNPGKRGTAASDTLLDKIQKAAEVVASAVLPPTEHQGIRLHDNHYRAVAAPSAPIEVAVPACAYNLPAGRPKVARRCPGQVGGGWEETDSGNSSSHNSSQGFLTNRRQSVDSKSAGTGSQSGASSGDLSERVEALQLADCGQEMALINGLTEGSKVFLIGEETQRFLKECSILNCEVVVELLSSKLQDPSQTVKMRALCAIACLMTSDLLSLERMFGATQRRLHQLSDGSAGPVANKATKILRQLQALTGGAPHAALQNITSSAPANLLHPDGLQATFLVQNNDSTLNQSEVKPSDLPVQSNCSSTGADVLLRDSKENPTNNIEDKCSSNQHEAEKNRSSEVKLSVNDAAAPSNRLSLFSGMELVTKTRSVCEKEMPHITETGSRLDSPDEESHRNQSAFSFVSY